MKLLQGAQKLILERDNFDSLELVEHQRLSKAIADFSQTNSKAIHDLDANLTRALLEENTFLGLISWDTLITIGITIFIFFLGYLVNHFYNKWLSWGEAGIIRNHFSEWINLHKESISNQIEGLNLISKQLKESKELQEEPLKVSSQQLKKLLETPNMKLMNIFVINSRGDKNGNSKAYFNLINSLEFLASFRSRLMGKYEEFTKGTEIIRNDWNKNYRELDELRVSLIRSYYGKDSREGQFAKKIARFSSAFMSGKTPDGEEKPKVYTDEWVKEFCIPLREIVNTEMSENLDFIDVQIMASKVEDLLIVHKRWEEWRNGFSKIFSDFKVRMEDSFQNVEKQISHFELNERVSFIKFQLFR